ncbi:Proline iminopeptidase [Bienertia sinuspersici]
MIMMMLASKFTLSLKTLPLFSFSPLPIISLSPHQQFRLSVVYAEQRRQLRLQVRNCVPSLEQQLNMALEKKEEEFGEVYKNLYPHIENYDSGFLKVSDIHSIYWEQSGNPNGHDYVRHMKHNMVLLEEFSCLSLPIQFSFFMVALVVARLPIIEDSLILNFTELILFDQRGSGKSTPHACLEENTTWDLIADIEKLRQHLEVPEWQVFGGSWGSTLALAYSQSHPGQGLFDIQFQFLVTGLVLRGIFLLRKKEVDWFYEGGAATIFPDAWEPFRDLIPEGERGCFLDAYHKRLNSDDKETQAFARVENHYFVNKGFFPSDSFLLDNIDKIRHIKCTIVQVCSPALSYSYWFTTDTMLRISMTGFCGWLREANLPPAVMVVKLMFDCCLLQGRYDVVCPMMSAWDLHKAWPEADFKVVLNAGHSANEPGITAELVAANERFKNLYQGK